MREEKKEISRKLFDKCANVQIEKLKYDCAHMDSFLYGDYGNRKASIVEHKSRLV